MPESFTISCSSKHKHYILKTHVHGHPRNVSTLSAIIIRIKCLSTYGVFFPAAPQPNTVHTHTHTHMHLVGLPWTSDRPVTDAATYTRPNKHMKRKSVTSAGFKPTIPAAANLSLRPHDHRDRSIWGTQDLKYIVLYTVEQNVCTMLNCYSVV
jgi:hypothetical protein